MNFSPLSERTSAEIRALAENEMRKITDVRITQGIRAFLIDPRLETRAWEWEKPLREYPVWIVAESSKYDYGIVFSDYGFAPECPWGLVFLSHRGFDADYCWYSTLEQTYRESRLIEEYDTEINVNS